MASEKLQCSLITPEAKIFDTEADSVVIPAHDGEIGILADRAPLVCKLGAGEMRVTSGDQVDRWFIDGGFAQVADNRVIVLTQRALKRAELDRSEAEQHLSRAREMKITDEISAKRKEHAEAGARAEMRLAQ